MIIKSLWAVGRYSFAEVQHHGGVTSFKFSVDGKEVGSRATLEAAMKAAVATVQFGRQSADDGGPAFPREDYQKSDAPGQRGMSLRDWFAGHAIVAVAGGHSNFGANSGQEIARDAYAIADWMIARRKQ